MPQSRPETVLSPRSSLSSSPFSSASSIDSPLISDSISDWAHNYSRESEHRSGRHHRRRRSAHYRDGIHSPISSNSNSLPSSASASDSGSVPITPWNIRPDLALPEASDRRQGHSSGNEHLNLDDVDDVVLDELDENNDPPLYLGHTRWKQAQGTPGQQPSNLPGDRTNARGTTLHRKSRSRTKHTYRNVYYEKRFSRDFFLILTLCFVLACFLICLTRPALASWFANPTSLLGLDELL